MVYKKLHCNKTVDGILANPTLYNRGVEEEMKRLLIFAAIMVKVKASNRELKHATFLSHGRQPDVDISLARTVVSLRFSN